MISPDIHFHLWQALQHGLLSNAILDELKSILQKDNQFGGEKFKSIFQLGFAGVT